MQTALQLALTAPRNQPLRLLVEVVGDRVVEIVVADRVVEGVGDRVVEIVAQVILRGRQARSEVSVGAMIS